MEYYTYHPPKKHQGKNVTWVTMLLSYIVPCHNWSKVNVTVEWFLGKSTNSCHMTTGWHNTKLLCCIHRHIVSHATLVSKLHICFVCFFSFGSHSVFHVFLWWLHFVLHTLFYDKYGYNILLRHFFHTKIRKTSKVRNQVFSMMHNLH